MTVIQSRPGLQNYDPLLNQLAASRYLWTDELARPEQLPPENDTWTVALFLSGRGWGKTRVGAEWIAYQAIRYPKTRWAVVAATFSDVRDTCAEGESGLVPILRRYGVLESYNRSIGEIRLTNGSRIKLFSAAEPDRLRGPQFHGSWCDELAAWDYPETWDQLQFGLRLGSHPQTVVTTTPRPIGIIKGLLARTDGSVHVVRGSTFDNAANLAPSALANLRERYEGTRLGRQELFAELLLDNPASLWRYDDILIGQPPEMKRVIIAVDPAVTNTEDSDETGIIICGKGVDNTLWVLGDYSCKDTTFGWAKRVAALYEEFGASLIVYEKNQGGNTQEEIIHSLDPYLPVKPISAKQGKKLRAEPVAMLYEQHKVFHSKHFEKLEDQYTSWDPETPGDSPDRLDAAVHGLTELADIGAGSRFLLDLASICGNCQQPNSKDATMCFSCKQPMNG